MARGASSTEGETLERLHGDEATLEHAIAEARREAAARVETARREAEAIASSARHEAEREATRLRDAWAEALDAEAAGSTAARDAELATLARLAARNRERAVARALAVVLGEGP